MKKCEIEFINGKIFFHKLQFMLFPMNSFICIFNEIIEKEKIERTKELLKNCSKIDSHILYKRIGSQKVTKHEKIKIYIQIINTLGIGEVQLKQQNSNKLYFIIQNPVLSNFYQKLYKKKATIFPEEIIVGYLENFISLIYSKTTKSIIKTSNNNKTLSILIEILNPIKEPILKHYYEIPSKELILTNVTKKVLINKHIVLKNGSLTLWKAYAVLIPYFFLIELVANLGEKYEPFFKILGNMQGKAAVEIQNNIFGIPKDKLVTQVIEQTDLVGFGRTNIIEQNPLKFKLLHNLNSHFGKFYEPHQYKSINLYTKGDIQGIYEFTYSYTTKLHLTDSLDYLEIIKKTRNLSEDEEKVDKYINSKAIFTVTSLRQ